MIRRLIDLQVTDLIQESLRRIRRDRIQRPSDAQALVFPEIAFSPAMKELRVALKTFLHRELYHHPKVIRMADKARRLLTALFEVYVQKPEQLPHTTRHRHESEDVTRVVCDYIAGMTDRFALEEHQKLFHPFERM